MLSVLASWQGCPGPGTLAFSSVSCFRYAGRQGQEVGLKHKGRSLRADPALSWLQHQKLSLNSFVRHKTRQWLFCIPRTLPGLFRPAEIPTAIPA